MKFKRLLAAMLGAMMLVSCFAFTASAQDTGTGVIISSLNGTGGVTASQVSKTQLYDAVNDVVFYRYKAIAETTMQWNAYNFGTATVDTTDNTVHTVYRMRTNTSAKPYVYVYKGYLSTEDYAAYTTAGGTSANGKFGGGKFTADTATKGDGTWETAAITIASPVYSNDDLSLSNLPVVSFEQLQIYLAGGSKKVAGDYYDVAYAVISNDEASGKTAVETASNYSSGYTISFSLNYDGADELTAAPTENPTREGHIFAGWATESDATFGEMDLYALESIPTQNTTYYAIWDSALITFNRRNGADEAITEQGVGLGEAIPFPEEPTYKDHKFLGWSTTKGDSTNLVDTETAVVTEDMVTNGATFYGVWESTHDSTQPIFFVTAQNNSNVMAAENAVGTVLYDAENDIVYKNFTDNSAKTGTIRCNMFGLAGYGLDFTTDSDTLYMVYYLRTNYTGKKPSISFNSTTNKNGVKVNGEFNSSPNVTITNPTVTGDDGTETAVEAWQKIVLPLTGNTNVMSELGICTHVDLNAIGIAADATNGEYFDIPAIAIFDNEEAANAYNAVEASKLGFNISFDLNYTGAEELTAAPASDPEREGYDFLGWSTNKDAETGEISDLTRIETVPTADTIYYAIWENVSADENVTVFYDTHGGSAIDAQTYVYNPIREATITFPAAPTKDGYTFLGWSTTLHGETIDTANVAVTEDGATYYAVWEMESPVTEAGDTLYISANGCDTCGNGLSAAHSVSTLAKANEIIAANESINTIVVVDTFKTAKDGDVLGVAGRTLTVTGNTCSAVFDCDANPSGTDDDLVLACPVTFRNITIKDGSGDGVIKAQGNKVVFDEGVSAKDNNIEIAGWSGDNNEIIIKSGTFARIFPGPVSASYTGNTVLTVDGGEIKTAIIMGHGWKGEAKFSGTFNATINDGTVELISMNSNGSDAAVAYRGLRYFTLNGGAVGSITTTEGSQYKDNSDPRETKSVSYRTGVTVFEINKAGIVTGKIALGSNIVTGETEEDDSTRIVIFNNGSYEKGKVTDTGAVVIVPTNGTIKADVTVDSDYTATLNGYIYTTDSANKYININGTNYDLATFTNADEATLAEETTVLIPAELFEEGENAAIFSEEPLYEITWVNGEESETTAVESGDVPTAPAYTKEGYTLSWTPEVVAATEDTTYTAVWTVNKHNVIYTLDGEEYNKTEYEYGAPVTILAAPEAKTGYSFGGWKIGDADAADFIMPDSDVTITGTYTANQYTVTYNVDNELYGEPDTYEYGETVTMREAPSKDGYTFSGWDKTLTTMPAENVTVSGTFTEDEEEFPTTPTYNTYGYYDALNGTYSVEVKFSGAKVNRGSFGFAFPTDQMTFKSVAANSEAGIELLGESSPIYANADGNYADTWIVSAEGFAGHIDATAEEVLVATFSFTMSAEQREAFEAGVLAAGKFTEYVVASPDAKYHNGENYLATPYATDFTLDTAAINYAGHTDTETTPKITYTTYGTYDEYNGTYSIDIKVEGSKINLGAFGLAFNADYMTFDPNAENAVVFAENIANYLDITLHNAADGYAFAFDGSSQTDGYIDASTEEVLIATINLTMTAEQRAAFVQAGKTMSLFTPVPSDNVTSETLAKYYDGENYLVSIYVSGLATPKLPAEYAEHKDEVKEATVADVEVEVTFASKNGKTNVNIAQITLDDGTPAALEEADNTEATITYTFKALTIGQKYTVKVEKNGYLAGTAEITVVNGENKIEMTLLAGDIKGDTTDVCGDGTIDLSDFVRIIRAFDEDAGDDFKATVDIDESGVVNVTDLAIIKANYNRTSEDNTITVNGESNGEEAAG